MAKFTPKVVSALGLSAVTLPGILAGVPLSRLQLVPPLLAVSMSAALALHAATETVRFRARGRSPRQQRGAVLLTLAYLSLAAAGGVVLILSSWLTSRAALAGGFACFAYVLVWHRSTRRMSLKKDGYEVRHFFDRGTLGGNLAREMAQISRKKLYWLFGSWRVRSAALPLPMALLIGAVGLLGASTAGTVETAAEQGNRTAPAAPRLVVDLPYPGKTSPLAAVCSDSDEVRAEFLDGVPASVGRALLKAWQRLGSKLLGCPEALPKKVGAVWLVSLAGGTMHPVLVIASAGSASAAVAGDDFAGDVWNLVEERSVGVVYPRRTGPYGTYQLVDRLDGGCELLVRQWRQPAIKLSQSTLQLLADLDPDGGPFTVTQGGDPVRVIYSFQLYARGEGSLPLGQPFVIRYATKLAVSPSGRATDNGACAVGTRSFLDRLFDGTAIS